MKKISVIGFGKIGQAVAANILNHNIPVNAVDIDASLPELFNAGLYRSNEPGLQQILNAAFAGGKLSITNDFSSVHDSIAVIVSIPLLIDEQKKVKDKPFLEAMKLLASSLSDNTVVVIETSLPVGFCRSAILPALASAGRKHGNDFWLTHSPERIKSGTMMQQLSEVPKIIGGITTEDATRAYDIYRSFFDKGLLHVVESIEAAEMLKLAGMIYRDVNIALSNQLAKFANARGIDFTALIPVINTDGEASLLQPGIGVGGHCTPVYPYFLIENFDREGLDFSLAKQGRLINNKMAAYAVSLVNDKVKQKKALILGLSFRPNVKEDSLSTAYLLHEVLRDHGYDVTIHDTEYSLDEIAAKGFQSIDDIYESGCEVVFLVTMHREYFDIDFNKLAESGVRYFVDGRNAVDKSKVEQAGIGYVGIGR